MDKRVVQAAIRLATAWALLMPAGARAQQAVASAIVTGTVYDPTDAVVVGAAVSLTSRDTNQVFAARTDGAGRYRLIYVPVGTYRLEVSASGFVATTVAITLSIGQAIELPLRLSVAAVTDSVNVVQDAPIVDTARTTVASTITPGEVDSLPLNGRNYLDLALLAPNVSRTNTRSNERFAETSAVPGTGISVAGQRNLGNTFIVDGLSANDDAADLAGTYFGEEVIREFQVITSGGGAEFGRAAAGVINVVTKSGTNDNRGRAYGFFRDDVLDARNPLARRKDPLSQSQYGLTFGGPIVQDRTFWFGNVERTAQDKSGVITISPDDVDAINRALEASRYPGPRVGTGEFTTGYKTFNLFGRVDHRVSPASRLELRYSLYDVASANARGVGGLNAASRGTRLDDTDQTAAATWQSSPSGSVINELRGQWTRSQLDADVNDLVGPAVGISGVANFGTSTSSPTARDLDLVQIADTLTLQRGSHMLKAGADFLHNRVTIGFPGALQGSYTFTTLSNLQRGTYQSYQQAFGEPSLSQGNPNLGMFLQDQWRLRDGLTVDAGLRYDVQWLSSPVRPDANNLSPRLGVAWAPADGRTVLRASGGLYFDRIPLRAMSNALQRDGVQYKVAVVSFGQASAPVFPAVLPSFPGSLVTAITTVDPGLQSGRSQQFALQLERAIGRLAAVTAGVSTLRGQQIIMSRNINVPTLTAAAASALGIANLGRPDPRFANISRYESIGDAWFKGVTLSLATRGISWAGARVSYTLSKAEDTAGNAFFSTPQDNFDIAADKGPSDNDQRHRLVFSGTAGGGRLARATAGLQFGYVISYATGVPFNVLAGSDLNNDTNNNDRPAGVGRNSARQPSTATVDVRLSRTFAVRGQTVDAMIEGFNLFNRVNILAVNSNYGTGSVPSPTFRQPTLAGDPRQIQVGLRWSF